MIAIRPMAYLSLSFDHRAIDGATADRFLATVKAYLEGYGSRQA
jgi:pyruvate/2-oxoglutarate dehydrogenase complex dihydrolipoamide acyltransferase (E2) component